MTCLLCNGVPDPNICDDLCESCLRDGEKLNELSPGQYRTMIRKIERLEFNRLRRIQRELRRVSPTHDMGRAAT